MRLLPAILLLLSACPSPDGKGGPSDTEVMDDTDDAQETVETDPPDTDVHTDPPDTDGTEPETDSDVGDTDTADSDSDVDDTDVADSDSGVVDDTDFSDTYDTDLGDTDDTDLGDTDVNDTDLHSTDDSPPIIDTDGESAPPDTDALPGPDSPAETGDSSPLHETGLGETGAPPTESAETGGDSGDSATTTSSAWSAPLTLDGDLSDCPAEAIFHSSSGPGPWACITWTATDLYIGWYHPDVGIGGPMHWVYAYFGGMTTLGGTSGVTYNTQQPAISPIFQHHLRWKASGTFNSLLGWTGSAWGDEVISYLWLGQAQVVEDNGNNVVEMKIPLTDLTTTDNLILSMGWIHELTGAESTYAGVPAEAFTDGYDPDIKAWYAFDLGSPAAPATYTPIVIP